MSAVLAVLWALAALVLAAVGFALVVLALPVHLRVRGAVHDGEPSGAVGAAWAFGLVAVALGGRGLAVRVAGVPVYRRRLGALLRRDDARGADAKAKRRARDERRREKRARKDERASKEKRERGVMTSFLDHRGTLLRMLRRLGRTLHLRLRLRGTVGLDDPADTLRLAEVLSAVAALPGVEADVEVDWLDETLDLEAVGSARIWAPETAAVVLGLWLVRENRIAVRALASGT